MTIALTIFVLSFWQNIAHVDKDSVFAFYMFSTRFWELAVGCILAYLVLYRNEVLIRLSNRTDKLLTAIIYKERAQKLSGTLQDVKSLVGLFLILSAVFALNKDMVFPGWLALLPTLGAFLLISAGSGAWVNRVILSNRLLVWVGLISYPLYLWHWSLLSFARIVGSGVPTREIRIAIVLVSFISAYLTYWLIEKPIRSRNSVFKNVTLLCLMVIFMVTLGYYSYIKEGFPKYRLIEFQSLYAPFKWDNSWGYDLRCRKQFPNQDQCLQTLDSSKYDAVIIGDSHAHHYYWNGISNFYKNLKKNLVLMGAGGCVPFFDLESGGKGSADYCVEKINAGLDFALKTDSVKTIILASRGPMYFSGHGFGDVDPRDRFLFYKSKPHLKTYPPMFEEAMRGTLERLIKAKKQVIFIIDIPELGFDPMQCVKTRPYFGHVVKNPCAVTRREFEDRNNEYVRTVESVLKEFPSVLAFRPSKYLCDSQLCWASKDGKMLYRNSDHLSFEGSQFVGDKFSQEMSKLIK